MTYYSDEILNKVLTPAEKKERDLFLKKTLETIKCAEDTKTSSESMLFDACAEKVDLHYLAMVIEKLRSRLKQLLIQTYVSKAESIPKECLFSEEEIAKMQELIAAHFSNLENQNQAPLSPEDKIGETKKTTFKKRGLGILNSLPKDLKIEEVFLPQKEVLCSNGYGIMPFLKYSESLKLVYVPAKYYIRRTHTPIYKCLEEERILFSLQDSPSRILSSQNILGGTGPILVF